MTQTVTVFGPNLRDPAGYEFHVHDWKCSTST